MFSDVVLSMPSTLEFIKTQHVFIHETWWRPLFRFVFPLLMKNFFAHVHVTVRPVIGVDIFNEILLRFVLVCDRVYNDEWFRRPHINLFHLTLALTAVVIKYTCDFGNVNNVYSILLSESFATYAARTDVLEMETQILRAMQWRFFWDKDMHIVALYRSLCKNRKTVFLWEE